MRLDRIHYPVESLGPGTRVAIWTAGCLKRCPGCISPSLLPLDSGRPVPVAWLAEKIRSIEPRPAGITVTGGEPFLQAPALVDLWDDLDRTDSMDLMVFTGYTLEELREDRVARSLLDRVDVLVDGEFRQEEPTELVWRGSANQRLHLLSPRARTEYAALPAANRAPDEAIGLDVTPDGTVYMTGIPRRGDLESLEQELEKRGVSWRHE